MKITHKQLRQIVQEETQRLVEESSHPAQPAIEVLNNATNLLGEDTDLINIVNKAKQEYWESIQSKIAAILTSYPDVWTNFDETRPPLGGMWSEISSVEDFKLIAHDDVRHLGPVGQRAFVGDPAELNLIRSSANGMLQSLWSAYSRLPARR